MKILKNYSSVALLFMVTAHFHYYLTIHALAVSLPLKTKSSLATALPIFHHQHEGSHAIAADLAKIPCVFSIGEGLSKKNIRSEDLSTALSIYFDSKGVDVTLMNQILSKQFRYNESLHTECQSKNISTFILALVRHDVPIHYFQSGFNSATFFLFRSDLMRFSLSLASQDLDNVTHPQFLSNYSLKSHNYNIEMLEEKSKIIIKYWTESADFMASLSGLAGIVCDKIKAIVYEDSLHDQKAFAEIVYYTAWKSTTGSNGLLMKGQLSGEEYVRTFTKAHPSNIESFVENSEEVKKFFSESVFAKFEDVIAKSQQKMSNCKLYKLILSHKHKSRVQDEVST